LADVSKEVSPELKYRPGLTKWKVFHRGKGARQGPTWHLTYESVPDWKRSFCKPTMFHDTYTYMNNKTLQESDPLNLARCLRLYPHDDNQGGFFCAVFEKTETIGRGGTVLDNNYTQDAWEDKSVRQKPMVDEIMDFASWYEKKLEEAYEKKGTPMEEREDVGLVKMLEETKAKEKASDEAAGFNC
jgi:hypothetical protein